MKRFIPFVLAVVCTNVFAQNEVRNLEDFNSLKVNSPFEVEITQTDNNTVTISGVKEESLENIKTEINEGELHIYSKGKIKSDGDVKIALNFKTLNSIKPSGAAELKSTNTIITDNMTITGSGATDLDLSLNTKELTTNLSGASDLFLKGSTENFNLTLSGASSLKAGELTSKNVVVNISGASDVRVHASESIKGTAKGASNISVKGNPPVKEINNSGAASANFRDSDISIKVGGNVYEIDDDKVQIGSENHNVKVNDDTTQVSWGNTVLVIIDDSVYVKRKKKKRRNHWVGVDLGINGFFDGNGSLDLSNPPSFEQNNPQEFTQFMEVNYRKSWTVSVNFMEFYIPVKKHNVGFVTGLGTEWNNYELKNNVRLTPQGGSFVYNTQTAYNENYTWGYIDTNLTYSKNRFKTWFINAPLLFEINTGDNPKRAFHISTGAILGYNLQTKMKYKYNLNGEDKKEKDRDEFNTNPFRVSLTTRVGYGWFNVFATYSLTPLFESGKGPELYPFTIGVTLLGF